MGTTASRSMYAEEQARERSPPPRAEERQEENAGNQEKSSSVFTNKDAEAQDTPAAGAMNIHQSTFVQQGSPQMSEYHTPPQPPSPPPLAKPQQQEPENDGDVKNTKIPSNNEETLAHRDDAPPESCIPAAAHAPNPSKKSPPSPPPKKSTAPLSPVNDNTTPPAAAAAKQRAPAQKEDFAAAAVRIVSRDDAPSLDDAAADVVLRHGNEEQTEETTTNPRAKIMRPNEMDAALLLAADFPVLEELLQQQEESCAEGKIPRPCSSNTYTEFPPRRLPATIDDDDDDDDRASDNPKAAHPAPSSFAQSGASANQITVYDELTALLVAEGGSGSDAASAATDLLGMFTVPFAAPHQERFTLDIQLQRAFAALSCDETTEPQSFEEKDVVVGRVGSISNAADAALVPQSRHEKNAGNLIQSDNNKAVSSLTTENALIAQSSSKGSTRSTPRRQSTAADDSSSTAKQSLHDSAIATCKLSKTNTHIKSSTGGVAAETTEKSFPMTSSSVETSTVCQADSTQGGTTQTIHVDSLETSPLVSRKRTLPCTTTVDARITKPRIESAVSGEQQKENAVETTADPASNVQNAQAKPKTVHRTGQVVNNSAPLADSHENMLEKVDSNVSSHVAPVDPSIKQESRSCPLFLNEQESVRVDQKDLEEFFLAIFRLQHRGDKDWNGLSFRTELAVESSRIIAHLSGAAKLVDDLLEALETWFSDEARRQNCKLMREHGCTVTVELDPKQTVGANLQQPKVVSEISVDVKPDGQLKAALGDSHNTSPDFSPFAIVDKIQGMPCKSIPHFKRLIARAAKTSEKLQLQLKVASPHQVDKMCRRPVLSAVTTQASAEPAADTESVDLTEMEETSPTPNEALKENAAISSEASSLSTSTERRSNASGAINTEAKLSAKDLVGGQSKESDTTFQPTAIKTPEESVQSSIVSLSDRQRKEASWGNTGSPKTAISSDKSVMDLQSEDGDPVFLDSARLAPFSKQLHFSPRPSRRKANILRSAIRTNKKKTSSIFRGSTQDHPRKKSVRFSLENVDGEPSPTESKRSVAENDQVVDRLPSLVLDHPCCDLITLFAAGCLSDVHSPRKIDDSRVLIHHTLQELEAKKDQFSSPEDSDNHETAVVDLTIKDGVLKIYSLAISAVEQARSLDAWARMQVRIRKIDSVILAENFCPSPFSKIKVEVHVVYETGRAEVLRRLPRVPFKEGTDMVFNTGTCQVNYNPEYLPDRCIVIKLFMVDGMTNDADEATTLLGEIVVRMSDLHDELSAAGEESKVCTFPLDAVPGNKKLLYARVHLQARRLCALNCIEKKRDTALKTMETVLERIPKLEKDWRSCYQEEALVPLSANILVGGSLSLLHAAVYLSDVSLVQRILKLGANPSAQSTVGSPIALAQQMLAAHKESIELQQIVGILNGASACPGADAKLDMSAADNASLNVTLQESVIQLTSSTPCTTAGVESLSRTSAPSLDSVRDTKESMKRSIQPPNENATGESRLKISKRRNGTVAPARSESSKSDEAVRGVAKNKNNGLPKTAAYKRNNQNEMDLLTGLPLMPMQNWLVPLNRQGHVCKHWDTHNKCKWYPHCTFIHCQQSWGNEDLESLWAQMDNHVLPLRGYQLEMGLVTERRYVGGKEWWTAGYRMLTRNGERGQEVFYAEGLQSHVSSQGVSWFQTKEEAVSAVQRVIIVSRYAYSRRITPKRKTYGAPHQLIQNSAPSDCGHYGPQRSNPSVSHENEAAYGVSRRTNNGPTSLKKSASILKRSKYSSASASSSKKEDMGQSNSPGILKRSEYSSASASSSKKEDPGQSSTPGILKRSKYSPASASSSKKEDPGQSTSPGILKRSKYSDVAPVVSASIPKLPVATRKHGLSAGEDVERKRRKRTKTTSPERRFSTNGQDLL